MPKLKEILLPDIGNFAEVEVIEVVVATGDRVQPEQAILTLESDKAAMEIPVSEGGVVREVTVKTGDRVSQGDLILMLEVEDSAAPAAKPDIAPPPSKAPAPAGVPEEPLEVKRPPPPPTRVDSDSVSKPHASPAVRKFARELGVNLALVTGSGRKGRIVKDDVQNFVKGELAKPRLAAGGGFTLPEMPETDFSEFGAIETKPLSRIKKLSGAVLHRNWLVAPHVTQHDEADITEMENFRKSLGSEAEKRGVKMTPLVFLIKATVGALREFPTFNASLAADKESLILKKYFHIGFAVDTPEGLVVPVIRDADQKGLFELATELRDLSARAREGKLAPKDMQGGCFTLSSLGGIGGTYFSPIINAPEVAIMGVSRAQTKPVWQNGEFVPRLLVPLSLSYDHRVIDGAEGARFITYFSYLLSDVRRLLL